MSEVDVSALPSRLQGHFANEQQQYETSTFGMWVFLVTEVMFFGGLFTAYLLYRVQFAEAFQHASHHLDITLGAFNTVVLIGSSVLVEEVFARPGLGKLMVGATKQKDYTLLQSIMVVYALIIVGINLLTDIIYTVVDPRVRYS